jgi:hypothetical protein
MMLREICVLFEWKTRGRIQRQMVDCKIKERKNRKTLVAKEDQFNYNRVWNRSNWLGSFRLCKKKLKDLLCVVILSLFSYCG